MKKLILNLDEDFYLNTEYASQSFVFENKAIQIEIDTNLREDTIYKLHIERGEKKHFVVLEKNDGKLIYNVEGGLFTEVGEYSLQVQGVNADESIIISNNVVFTVERFINADEEVTPEQISEIDKLLIRVEVMAEKVESIYFERVNDGVIVHYGEKTYKIFDGQKGNDGISPSAEVAQTTTGATITITDEHGTTTADIENGTKGNDGYSPLVTAVRQNNGVLITITDAQGKTTAFVYDGNTPKKGIDYWTQADKQEIVDATIEVVENVAELKENKNNDINDSNKESETNYPSNLAVTNYVAQEIAKVEMHKGVNAIVHGDPAIKYGQVSGFSTVNYLKFPFLVDFENKPFAIDMEFDTGANVTSQENIFDSDFGLAFAVRQGRFVFAISSNGTNWDLGESVGVHQILPNTSYRVRFSWDKTTYKLEYSIDGGKTYITDVTKSANVQPYPTTIFIGVGENFEQVVNYFTGIINMNNARLTIDGTVVWTGAGATGDVTKEYVDIENAKQDVVISELKETVDRELYGADSSVVWEEYRELNGTGVEVTSTWQALTNYLSCDGLSEIVFTHNTEGWKTCSWWFDENKLPISSDERFGQRAELQPKTIPVPNGAKYFRVTLRNDGYTSFVWINEPKPLGLVKDVSNLKSETAEINSDLTSVKADLNKLPTDVQINGTSIVDENKVANVPLANTSKYGLIKPISSYGFVTYGDGQLGLVRSDLPVIRARVWNDIKAISLGYLDVAVREALCHGVNKIPSNVSGEYQDREWTDTEKANARARMGVGGKYELIEEFILAEDTNVIEKSAEPNGTPYKFSRIRVEIFSDRVATSTTYVSLNINGSNSSYTSANSLIRDKVNMTTEGSYALVLLANAEYGFITGKMFSHNANSQQPQGIIEYTSTKTIQSDFISLVGITAYTPNSPLKAGVKIKIYGVRI